LNYRSEIDGLRAVALLPVILFHANFELFKGGFLGVDIFFVISGYLITTIILKDLKEGNFSFSNFYERRARRILPALFFVVLCCLPFALMWMLPPQLKDFSQALISVSTFTSNFLFWKQGGYFSTLSEENPLIHTWSLAIEEQFYILFPILMVMLWKFSKKYIFHYLLLIFILSLMLSDWGSRAHFGANFYLAPTRAWELLSGSLCALLIFSRQYKTSNLLSAIGMGMIIFSFLYYDHNTRLPSMISLVPVIGTALLILYCDRETLIGRLLSVKSLVNLGLISYSAYLWHQPLFAFYKIRNIGLSNNWIFFFLILISFVLAYYTWKYIEQPFRDKKKKTRREVVISTTIAAIVISGFGFIVNVNDGVVKDVDSRILDAALAKKDVSPNREKCLLSTNNFHIEVFETCHNGIESEERIVFLGDSHAGALAYPINNFLEEKGVSFSQLTVSGCPPFFGLNAAGKRCDISNNHIFDYTIKYADVVVISSRWSVYILNELYDNNEGGIEKGRINPFLFEGLWKEYKRILKQIRK